MANCYEKQVSKHGRQTTTNRFEDKQLINNGEHKLVYNNEIVRALTLIHILRWRKIDSINTV